MFSGVVSKNNDKTKGIIIFCDKFDILLPNHLLPNSIMIKIIADDKNNIPDKFYETVALNF